MRGTGEAGQGQRLHERSGPFDDHPLHTVRGRRRHDGPGEAEAGRFSQPTRRLGGLAELAGQADLTTGDEVGRDGHADERRHHGQAHAEIAARLGEAHAAHRGHVHVHAPDGQPGPLLQHRGEQRQAAVVEALGRAPRQGQRAGGDEGLDLHQQWPLALDDRHDRRARHAEATVGQEQAARVGDADEPGFGHLEQAELVRRPEAMLHGPQQPERVVAVALEGEHRVDHVLEHPRTGQAALLGHVADEQDGDAAPLGLLHEAVGALTDLRDRARRRAQLRVDHRLDGVDDDRGRTNLVEGGDDGRQDALGHEPQAGRQGTEPLGPRPHLLLALLGRDVEHRLPRGRPLGQGLQQERGLADAGLAAQEGDRARHEPSAQDPVELGHAGGPSLAAAHVDLEDGHGPVRRHEPVDRPARWTDDLDLLHKGVPAAARRGSDRPTSVTPHRTRCSGGWCGHGPWR